LHGGAFVYFDEPEVEVVVGEDVEAEEAHAAGAPFYFGPGGKHRIHYYFLELR
jgi:hypothetical protein